MQMQMQRRMLARKCTDDLRERQRLIADRGIQYAKLDTAAQFSAQSGGVTLETVNLAKQPQRFLMELLTLRCQTKTAAPAMTQHNAHQGLQLAHVGADGRRGQVEFLLCRGKTLMSDHASKDAQQACFRQYSGHIKLHRIG